MTESTRRRWFMSTIKLKCCQHRFALAISSECATKGEVQVEGPSTIGADGGAVDSMQGEGGSVFQWGWNHAYLGACVDEKLGLGCGP